MLDVTEKEERQIVLNHFQIGLRNLYARDIRAANAGDVRMGTFVLCAAFLDTLALTYSAGLRVPGKKAAMWRRFIDRYLGERYAVLRDAYRCRGLHMASWRACPGAVVLTSVGHTHATS